MASKRIEEQAVNLTTSIDELFITNSFDTYTTDERRTKIDVFTNLTKRLQDITTKLEKAEASKEQEVTPWKVECEGGVDYDKLIEKFGCERIDDSQIQRVGQITKKIPHRFLRRGIFYAQKDLNVILDAYEKGEKFYVYTGRGPSSEALHLGHLIPFLFAKYMQDAFGVLVLIQLTDDEKCIWKNLSVDEAKRLAHENAKDIIACGFDITKTFIFTNFGYAGGAFSENVTEFEKHITLNQYHGIFGFTGHVSVAKISYPAKQAVPSFPSSFPHLFTGKDNLRCLIPCAIDQDPYFRMTRDVAPKMGYQKPALIESKFFPALQGNTGKMSASDPNSAIYVTDSAEDIKKKINNAVTGGRDTLKEQEELGADLEKDIPFQYLRFFLEDDEELELIEKKYGSGKEYASEKMRTGEVKKRLIEVLTQLVEQHQKARAGVTDEMVDAFMAVRPLPHMFD